MISHLVQQPRRRVTVVVFGSWSSQINLSPSATREPRKLIDLLICPSKKASSRLVLGHTLSFSPPYAHYNILRDESSSSLNLQKIPTAWFLMFQPWQQQHFIHLVSVQEPICWSFLSQTLSRVDETDNSMRAGWPMLGAEKLTTQALILLFHIERSADRYNYGGITEYLLD